MHPFGAIIIGLIAGWIAGKLMRGRGYGIIADVVLGLIGAVLGQWIFARLGIQTGGRLTFLAMASRPDRPEAAAETLNRIEPLLRRGCSRSRCSTARAKL